MIDLSEEKDSTQSKESEKMIKNIAYGVPKIDFLGDIAHFSFLKKKNVKT